MRDIAVKATVDRAREDVVAAINELMRLLQDDTLHDIGKLRDVRWRIAMASKRMMVIQRKIVAEPQGRRAEAIAAVRDVIRRGMTHYEAYLAHAGRWIDEGRIQAHWNDYRTDTLTHLRASQPVLNEWFDRVHPALFSYSEEDVKSAA